MREKISTRTIERYSKLYDIKRKRYFSIFLYSQKLFIIKKPVDPHKMKGLPVYF